MFSSLIMADPSLISFRDKSGVKAIGRASIEVLLSVSGKPRKCILNDVVYAPTMAFNMLSVCVMNRTGKKTILEQRSCRVEKRMDK